MSKQPDRVLRCLDISVAVLAMMMVAYLLIALFRFPLSVALHGNTFLTFAILLVYLPLLRKEIAEKRKLHIVGLSTILFLGLLAVVYIYLFSERLVTQLVPRPLDIVAISFIILAAFEATRRSLGLPICILTLVFMAYTFFGQYLPPPLYHSPVGYARIMGWMGASLNDGIFGSLLYVASDIVFMFIIFGAVMELTGGRQFFIHVGNLVGSRIRGGSAHTAVVSSALFGTLSGSPVANVVVTGPITIPIMKKAGIRSEMAGAIEAIASSGGSIMPPVMGVVAFIMAGITGLSYTTIAFAAIIPALLYYGCLGWAVYLYGGKQKIAPIKEKVDLKQLALYAPLFLIPFAVIVFLLAMQLSAQYAAAWAMLASLVLGMARKQTRPSLQRFVARIAEAVKQAATIGMLLALSGLILTSFSLTTLGPKLGSLIWMVGGGNLAITLLMGMVISLLIGMAAPGSGDYLIVALMLAPMLIAADVSVLQAHFFALYFAVIGYITPPNAPSVLVASPIAGSDFVKTGIQAVKFSLGTYVVPFLFVWQPAILGQFKGNGITGIISVFVAFLIVVTMEILLFNYYLVKLSRLEAVLNLVSLLAFIGYIVTRGSMVMLAVGVTCFGFVTVWQAYKRRASAIGLTRIPASTGS